MGGDWRGGALVSRAIYARAYDEERARLDGFKNLENDWDSYGSLPIAAASIEMAHDVLRRAEAIELPAPQCFPGSDGDVSFESDYRDRGFILHCEPDGTVGWLLCPSGDSDTWLEDDFPAGESPVSSVDDAITRVLEWAKAQWLIESEAAS